MLEINERTYAVFGAPFLSERVRRDAYERVARLLDLLGIEPFEESATSDIADNMERPVP